MEVICLTCNKKFMKKFCIAAKQKKHFCCWDCYINHNRSKVENYFVCKTCGKRCYKRPSEQGNMCKYCCMACVIIGRKKAIERECVVCKKTFEVIPVELDFHKYCSLICRNIDSRKERCKFRCECCDKEITRSKSQVCRRKHIFCSNSCKGKWYAINTIQKRRSKAECILAGLIGDDYPNLALILNSRSILSCGYEIDIFIEEKNLAIEINGPCHYFCIYGTDKLKTIQQHDQIKYKEIYERRIQLLIIDIVGVSKIDKFMKGQYIDNVKPLLN